MYKRILLAGLASLVSLSCVAATFTVTPLAGHPLPTFIDANETAYAFYTVTNNTGKILSGIHLPYLPNNVTQVTTGSVPNLCPPTFSLAPGLSCTLQLLVTGQVSANSADPHQHLFVCLPGNTTCSGTAQPLHVSTSGWTNSGLPVTINAIIHALATSGNTVYVAGTGSNSYPTYWTLQNNRWTSTEPINHGETGQYAAITTLNPNPANNVLYLGVTGAAKAWVYKYTLSPASATDTGLLTLNQQGPPPTYDGPISSVQESTYNPRNETLYTVGMGMKSDLLPNVPNDYSLFGGRIYYYYNDVNGWTETSPSMSLASFQSFSSMVLDSTNTMLYISGYGFIAGIGTGPMIVSYNTTDNTWGRYYIVFPRDNFRAATITSVALDSDNNLYAAGTDRYNAGGVWAYINSEWQHLPTPPSSQSIFEIRFNSRGQLFAVGKTVNGHGNVWSWNSITRTWTTLTMSINNGVFALAFDSNDTLYALGLSVQNVPQVWSYPNA